MPVRPPRSQILLETARGERHGQARQAGVSMEPDFHEGDLVFVDPEVVASHGKYVVVLLNSTNETTFKQLVVEGERKYLRALNPAWPERIIEVDSDATICGVVVFKGMVV